VIGISFFLYADQTGGAPLWMETQNVKADATGHYTALLGRTKSEGLPVDLFVSGEARWLGVQVEGQPEQPRVLLLSVPYAFKAADAETLGGKPASAFALVPPATNQPAGVKSATTQSISAPGSDTKVGGSGTAGFVARWVGVRTLGNSALFQKNGNVGIGTAAPLGLLHVNGLTQIGPGTTTPAGMLGVASTSENLAGLSAAGFPGALTSTEGVHGFGADAVAFQNYFAGAGVIGTGGNGAHLSASGAAGVVGNGGGGSASGGPGVIGTGGGSPFSGAPGVEGIGGAGSVDGDGVVGSTPNGGTIANAGAYAGNFHGDVNVSGTLFASTKNFKIDHPLDPGNKYLVHASVESSEMMNIYSGNAILDRNGEAVVLLPAWLEALNRDFRYQLTAVGAPSPGLYIAQKISNRQFKIAGGSPGSEVSWQITAARADAFAKAHPLIVEQTKSSIEHGYFIHPELFGAPEEKGIEWARHPDLMRKAKAMRLKSVQNKAVTR
jgi:hypothetical protein